MLRTFIKSFLIILLLNSSAFALTVASYNIKNFGKKGTYTDHLILVKIIKKMQADLIAVQEIVDTALFKKVIESYFPNYKVSLTNCGGRGRQRLGFIYKTSILKLHSFSEVTDISPHSDCFSGVRPAAVGHFSRRDTDEKFTAFSLHLKSGGSVRNTKIRAEQFKLIIKYLAKLRSRGIQNILLMGDLNTTHYLLNNKSSENYQDFLRLLDSYDYGSQISCTAYWWGAKNDGLQYLSQLDHIILSGPLWNKYYLRSIESMAHCQKLHCEPGVSPSKLGSSFTNVSDHCPVVAKLF